MKYLIFILLLALPLSLSAQLGRYPFARPFTASSTPANEYTDDFEAYSTGDLDGQGDWVVIDGSLVIAEESSNNVFKGNTDGLNAAYYDKSFSDDQYSEVTATAVYNYSSPCPIVRASEGTGGTYYGWYHETSTYSRLIRVVNGSVTILEASSTGWTSGDVLRLEVDGDTLFCYKNGALDTSMSSDGKYTDDSASKLSSGKAGILHYYQDTRSYGDLWKGGNL